MGGISKILFSITSQQSLAGKDRVLKVFVNAIRFMFKLSDMSLGKAIYSF